MTSCAGRADLGVDEDGDARSGRRPPASGLEASRSLREIAVVRGAPLDRAGPRRVERQRWVVPVGRVHAARHVGHDPVGAASRPSRRGPSGRRGSARRGGSRVAAMTFRPVARRHARIAPDRRPSPIGVISTIDWSPVAMASRTSSPAFSASSNSWPSRAGERSAR